MKFSTPLGIFFAVLLHVGFILFGGWLFLKDGTGPGSTQQVELLSEDDIEKQQEKKTEPEAEQIENESEKPPDMAEIMRKLEKPAVEDAPD